MSVNSTRVPRPRRYLLTPFAILAGTMLLAGCATASAPSGSSSSAPATSAAPTSSAAGSAATSKPAVQASPVAAQASPAAAAQSSPVVAQSSPATAGASSSTAARKVNPNTASIADIQAALEANGVPQAARWAREVDEYKPYPTDDPNFGKLRQNLAKYNPAPDVLEKIIASLSLA